MQIISSRRLLFQKTTYHDEVVDGKPTGFRVAAIEAKIIVNADTNPQIVPEWVKDDELYNICVDEGVIMQVTAKGIKPKTSLKGMNSQVTTPVAEVIKPDTEEENDPNKTGWGAKG